MPISKVQKAIKEATVIEHDRLKRRQIHRQALDKCIKGPDNDKQVVKLLKDLGPPPHS